MNVADNDRSVWASSFSDDVRQLQLHDDSAAWRAVTGILLTIVTVGTCLAVFTVWLCT